MRRCLALVLVLWASGCDGGEGPDAGRPSVGAPCNGSCGDGLSCVRDARFRDGYCSAPCDDAACPEGSVCDEATSPPLCMATCRDPSSCRDGYQCWRGACRPACAGDGDCRGGVCVDGRCDGPACLDDAECPTGSFCAGGACIPREDGGGRIPTGLPCANDAECASGICLDASLGGACASPCDEAEDCLGLAVEAGCSAVPASPSGVRTLCTPLPAGSRPAGSACAADGECQARTCQDRQCTEACADDGDCLVGQVCADLPRFGGTWRGCGYTPLEARVEEVPLGTQAIGAGRVTPLDLALPPDTVSLTLRARRVGGDPLPLVFGSVVDASGARTFDLSEIFAWRDPPLRWLPIDTGSVITLLTPNTTPDRLPMRAGQTEWTVGTLPRFEGDTGESQVELSCLVVRAPGGVGVGGALDVTVFLVGVGLSASAAASDARLQGALARFDAILGPHGLSVGEVSYLEVGGADATTYSVISSTEGEDSELAGLFRLSRDQVGRRLSVFLVRSIEGGGEGFAALGIAGGIPGPVGVHGTEHSGVVLAFDPGVVGSGSAGAAIVGHVLAHEVGHYLGLFHATEAARPCGPGETPADDCAPFGGGDVLADTTRGDMGNLMYWSLVGAGANDALSGGQGRVLRASALVAP